MHSVILLWKHFGHHVAVTRSDLLSEVHVQHPALTTKIGAVPKIQPKGLLIMLEQISGVTVETKLRAILLMGADLNCHNRPIFGDRMNQHGRTD